MNGSGVGNAASSPSRSSSNPLPDPNPNPAANLASPSTLFRSRSSRMPIPSSVKPFVWPQFETDDQYERIEQVGQGTFGTVFKARSPTGEMVALKAVKIDDDCTGFAVTSIREIKTLQSLSHPNVIELKGVVASKDAHKDRSKCHVYEVFPYIQHDLTGLLDNRSLDFSIPLIKCFFKQILEGVYHCHRKKIIHRDIKCSNILVDDNGCIKIADFGLARPLNNDTQYTHKVVTLWYRSPELLLGERKYGCSVDMWSLGCVLAEMFCRKPLFPGKKEMDQLELIFQLCGSPDESSALPGLDTLTRTKTYSRQIRKVFDRFGTEAADLLDQLLKLDPTERITAKQALDHDFFFVKPLPIKPEQVPHCEPSNEFRTKRMKELMMKRKRDENLAKSQAKEGKRARQLSPHDKVTSEAGATQAHRTTGDNCRRHDRDRQHSHRHRKGADRSHHSAAAHKNADRSTYDKHGRPMAESSISAHPDRGSDNRHRDQHRGHGHHHRGRQGDASSSSHHHYASSHGRNVGSPKESISSRGSYRRVARSRSRSADRHGHHSAYRSSSGMGDSARHRDRAASRESRPSHHHHHHHHRDRDHDRRSSHAHRRAALRESQAQAAPVRSRVKEPSEPGEVTDSAPSSPKQK